MSNTIAHRAHVQHHVPLMPILAVIIVALIAAVFILAADRPQTTTLTGVTESISSPAIQPAAVAAPESPVFRHAEMRVRTSAGEYPRAYLANRHHLVDGASLDPVSTQPSGSYEQPDYPRVGGQ